MRRSAIMVAAAGLVVGLSLTVRSAEAQAPSEMVQKYGYQFCVAINAPGGERMECMYTTLQQCQAAASGSGYCGENPAYIAARVNAGPAPQPQRR